MLLGFKTCCLSTIYTFKNVTNVEISGTKNININILFLGQYKHGFSWEVIIIWFWIQL